MGEIEIKYRVYYKQNQKNINHSGFWYTDAYDDVERAREVLNFKKDEVGFIEGHIKQEVTTKIIVQ